jgi:hypothetical protein
MPAQSIDLNSASDVSAARAFAFVPDVDVRIAALTVSEGRLLILMDENATRLQLPRSSPAPSETIDFTARVTIRGRLGFPEQYLEQLYTLGVEEERRWKIVISYVALISSTGAPASILTGKWAEIDCGTDVSPGDALVIDYALFRVRAKLDYTTIGFYLLPQDFTLRELQTTYETVLARKLDKRNFRRRMTSLGILSSTGLTRREGSHRPARLYRFSPDRDRSDYLTPPWATAEEND